MRAQLANTATNVTQVDHTGHHGKRLDPVQARSQGAWSATETTDTNREVTAACNKAAKHEGEHRQGRPQRDVGQKDAQDCVGCEVGWWQSDSPPVGGNKPTKVDGTAEAPGGGHNGTESDGVRREQQRPPPHRECFEVDVKTYCDYASACGVVAALGRMLLSFLIAYCRPRRGAAPPRASACDCPHLVSGACRADHGRHHSRNPREGRERRGKGWQCRKVGRRRLSQPRGRACRPVHPHSACSTPRCRAAHGLHDAAWAEVHFDAQRRHLEPQRCSMGQCCSNSRCQLRAAGIGRCGGAIWPNWLLTSCAHEDSMDGWRWPRWSHRHGGMSAAGARRNRNRGASRHAPFHCHRVGRREGGTERRAVRVAPRLATSGRACMAMAMLWAVVFRYGEARHPGPPPPKTASAGCGAAVYPKPLRPGFRDVRCSGYEGGVPGEAPRLDRFQLEVETVNATAWRSALRRMERTTARVVLVQETKVREKDIARFSAQALRRGWQTIWTPAIRGKKGKASGGAVICARMPVTLSQPPRGPSEVVLGRVVAAMMEAPGCRPTVLYCGYLKDGIGADGENLSHLARTGAHRNMQPEGIQMLMGADFNFTPQALEATDFPSEVGGVVIHPGDGATTCRTAKSASLLDYFVVSKGLAKGVERIDVVERSGVKTHTPVILRFHPRLTSLKALALRKPPTLGTEPIIGPRRPPPNWAPLTAQLEKIATKARRVGRKGIDDEYQRAFENWADLAEQEVQDATGERVPKKGLRGRAPRLFWRSILPEKVVPRASDAVIAIRAFASALDDIRRHVDAFGGPGTSNEEDEMKASLRADSDSLSKIEAMTAAEKFMPLIRKARALVAERSDPGAKVEPPVVHPGRHTDAGNGPNGNESAP